jgi:hypothetical protein
VMNSLRSKTHSEDALLSIVNEALDRGADLSGLLRWSNGEAKAGRLAPLFPGLLSALRYVGIGTSPFTTIVDYLSGASIPQIELNNLFRSHAPHIAHREVPRMSERAAQSTRFLARMFVELGYSGWIVLFDELELIRLQGPVSRGKAYAEMATWFGVEHDHRIAGVGAVGAVTRDFVSSCIEGGTDDLELVWGRLATSVANSHLAPLARTSMEFLVEEQDNECSAPDGWRLKEIQHTIRNHYAAGFGASPTELKVPTTVGTGGVSMRACIRRWITIWDLERQGRRDAIDDYEVTPVWEDSVDDPSDG